MKALMNKIYIGLLAVLMVSVNSCVEPEDLMTADAKTGGLVNPLTSNVPYKLGATPSFDVDLSVVKGPGIVNVEVLKSFETVDGDMSKATTRLYFTLRSMLAEHERLIIAERIKSAMNYLVRGGKLKTKPPFGYKSPGKKMALVEEPEEMAIVKHIRKMTQDDPSIRSILQIVVIIIFVFWSSWQLTVYMLVQCPQVASV